MCGGCCIKGLRYEEGTGKLQYFSCNEWRDVIGIPPSAINPDVVLDPDDPLNETPPAPTISCFKATGFADLIFSIMDSLVQVRDVSALTVGILALLEWKGGAGKGYGDYVYDQKLLGKVLNTTAYLNLEDNISDWETGQSGWKEDFICQLQDLVSKEAITTLADYELIKSLELGSESEDLNTVFNMLIDFAIVPGEAIKISNQYVREQRGDCTVCNPAPVDPATIPPDEGCYRLQFEKFGTYWTSDFGLGEQTQASMEAAPRGVQVSPGVWQGQLDGETIYKAGVMLKFNEPVTLTTLNYTMAWIGSDPGDINHTVWLRRASDQMWVNVFPATGSSTTELNTPIVFNPNVSIAVGEIDGIFITGLTFNSNFRISGVTTSFTTDGGTHTLVPFGLTVCDE